MLGISAILVVIAGVALAGALHTTPQEAGVSSTPAHLGHLTIAARSANLAGPTSNAGPIIGTNDAAGWGPAAARTIRHGHITWDRIDLDGPYNTLNISLHDGFKVLAIAGNVEVPLSEVNPSQWGAHIAYELTASKGISIAEAGNEMYLKGNVANPLQYGRMYMAAIEAMHAAGIHTRLLFNMTGDIPLDTWSDPGSWSEDANGGGWLREAVSGVPGLASAILANGVSVHPYGALRENEHDDWGIASVAAEETVANAVLGGIPPVYVTEIGYSLSFCGSNNGACSRSEQASKLLAAYKVFLADPHVDGIWWYQSHDDSTGHYGFMTEKSRPRPAFRVLAAIGEAVGQ
ncbi:MAG TPA: hypothetical protein VIH71_12560 [Solirubrobacteraceae bacterium]